MPATKSGMITRYTAKPLGPGSTSTTGTADSTCREATYLNKKQNLTPAKPLETVKSRPVIQGLWSMKQFPRNEASGGTLSHDRSLSAFGSYVLLSTS